MMLEATIYMNKPRIRITRSSSGGTTDAIRIEMGAEFSGDALTIFVPKDAFEGVFKEGEHTNV